MSRPTGKEMLTLVLMATSVTTEAFAANNMLGTTAFRKRGEALGALPSLRFRRRDSSSSTRSSTSTSTSSKPWLGPRGGAAASPSLPVAVSSRGGGESDAGAVGLTPSTFNLVKNIVGAGVLSLPAGVAAFSSSKVAVAPACALVMSLGLLSCYCFTLIGRLSAITGASTYRGAIEGTMGPRSGKMLGAACTMKTGVACLMYSIIIGDITETLSVTAGLSAAVPALAARWKLLPVVTASVLTPLCLMRSFAVLSYTSLLGILGTVYTAIFMAVRLVDKSYAPGGKFFEVLKTSKAALPAFGSTTTPAAAFVLVSMLSTAFIAHYNAPKYYSELKDTSVKRFNVLSLLAFSVAIAFFGGMMSFGFLTFGSACNGFVLNNYAASDSLATIARGAILASIIFGYPLTFVGFRDGLLELLGNSAPSWRTKDLSGIVVLAAMTVAATFLRDLGKVSSVAGALLGSSIIYIFPALAFIASAKGDPKQATESKVNRVISGVGVGLGAIGLYVSLLAK